MIEQDRISSPYQVTLGVDPMPRAVEQLLEAHGQTSCLFDPSRGIDGKYVVRVAADLAVRPDSAPRRLLVDSELHPLGKTGFEHIGIVNFATIAERDRAISAIATLYD